ncbi:MULTISPECIES: acyl-CoA thioesterase [unclassified Leucobacter]|uniref:acyl-CoA thioesterase n=1 Tax=unclassified Leucobacter TaxID=2621730 RepID=UPI00301A26B8
MSEYRHVVRKWVKPEDLNQHGALFGGRLLQWVDEEAAIVAVTQLGTIDVVTRHMSAIDFSARADRGDLLELEYRVEAFGRTSVTLSCRVENAVTGQEVLTLESIVFVAVDAEGRAVAHGRTSATEGTERLRDSDAPTRRVASAVVAADQAGA